MDTFSITIRPRKFNIQWAETLENWFKKKEVKYVIGKEKADSNTVNHLQVAVEMNSRVDNIKRSITSLLQFKPEDDMEKKYWIKCSKTDDKDMTFGYCLKEGNVISNLEGEDKKKYLAYYLKRKQQKEIGKWTCKGINGLFDECRNYVINTGITKWKWKRPLEGGFTIKSYPMVKTIITRLHTDGRIPTSLALKYKPFMEQLWKDIWKQDDLNDLVSYEGDE